MEDNGTRFTQEKLNEPNQLLKSGDLSDQGTGLYNAGKCIRLFYKNWSRMELKISHLGGLYCIC